MNNKLSRLSTETFEVIDKYVGVALRIPGLFMIDNYWKSVLTDKPSDVSRHWYQFVQYFVLVNGFLLLLLPLANLKRYYLHVINCLLLLASFYLSYLLICSDSNKNLFTSILLLNLNNDKVQSLLHYFNNDVKFKFSLFILRIMFDFFVVSLLQVSSKILTFNAIVYVILIVFYFFQLFTNIFQMLSYLSCFFFALSFISYFFKHMTNLLNETKLYLSIVKTQGFIYLCTKIFKKIFVPVHYLIFWNITFLFKLYLQSISTSATSEQTNWTQILVRSACSTYITPITILSISVTVTYLSCFVLSIFKLYLWGSIPSSRDNGASNREHNGWEEGVTTLMLTSITYLIDMNENTRIAVMIIISLVVLSSLLQSMLEISEPVILSLNINHSSNRVYHFKVLLLCAFLFSLPLYITYVLSQIFPVNFWIAVVFSTSLLISIKVLDLLIVHCLFWWDSCQDEPLEYLDEVVFFARSFTKILEFIISISVLVMGFWEAANNRLKVVNSVILLLHYYFNVYQKFNDGLKSYRLRRDANRIVNTLSYADNEKIIEYNDLCSICFLEMNISSRLIVIKTNCNHLFHRLCIKKWLCFHNRCPLCAHAITIEKEKKKD